MAQAARLAAQLARPRLYAGRLTMPKNNDFARGTARAISPGMEQGPMTPFLNTAAVISMSFTLASAQSVFQVPVEQHAVPVHMVVTAEPLYGGQIPSINRGDVQVLHLPTDLPVTEWLPLQGDMAGLELYFLIDERVDPSTTARFEELRRFISSQPATTAVGVAYMKNGEARIAQPPTSEHTLAANAIRTPTGDNSFEANPFTSLSALINGWPTGALRREVVLVTDGIDVFEDVGGATMYLDIGVADAQRAGVEVFCFFAPSAGHAGHSAALIHGGQAYLQQIAEETGGESYFNVNELEPATSFDPYLADVARHLARQYRITFLATPVVRRGVLGGESALQRVAFRTPLPNVELTSAYGFYLGAEESRP